VFDAERCTGITGGIVILQHCPDIEQFWGSLTGITGDIAVFQHTPKATYISVEDTRVTGDKQAIKRALPKCILNF